MTRSVIIEKRRRLFDGFFKLDEYAFRRTDKAGVMSEPLTNLVFERGDAAAVLVRDVEREVIVLVRQFRLPAYLRRDKQDSADDGVAWIEEAMAGIIRDDETPEQSARRELEEELGYRPVLLEPITTVFVSPGGTTERIHLFHADVTRADLIDPDAAGAPAENEDIERVEYPTEAFFARIARGEIVDAKTVIAGLWLQARLGAQA